MQKNDPTVILAPGPRGPSIGRSGRCISLSGRTVATHQDPGQKRSRYLGQAISSLSNVETRPGYDFLPGGGV